MSFVTGSVAHGDLEGASHGVDDAADQAAEQAALLRSIEISWHHRNAGSLVPKWNWAADVELGFQVRG
jgi:hypothetical protein